MKLELNLEYQNDYLSQNLSAALENAQHPGHCHCSQCQCAALENEQPFETLDFFNNAGGRFKWSQPDGAGSPVNVTYAFANNFQLDGLSKSDAKSLFKEALKVWSDVAPLNFQEIEDPGNDQEVGIRVKSEFIDGNSNTLAFAFFPRGGDITFDSGESSWSQSLFLETAVHEIGHALGLGHEDGTNAIMNSSIRRRYDGPGSAFLFSDDIDGIRSLYGNGRGSVTSLDQSPTPGPTPNPTPNGIRGNRNNNRLIGTQNSDRIYGLGGNDTLDGRSGNDKLFGGDGGDRIAGSLGKDTLSGGTGRDRLVGGQNNDVLLGGKDRDVLIGVRPNDPRPGEGERDTMTGGSGPDIFMLGNKNKVFYDDRNSSSGYALIKDFNLNQGDILQLKGKASDYSLGASFRNVPNGLTLAKGQGANRDLIAVIQGSNNFTLNSNNVRFV